MSDVIREQVELAAPIARVWRAISDAREFGAWFRVAIDAPFAVGEPSRGHMTEPGYEHVAWSATVRAIEPERRFAFSWHPFAIDPAVDYSGEAPTLVEFRLEPNGAGTALDLTETGFDALPDHRRDEAHAMHVRGWAEQMRRIRAYVE